MSDSARGSRLFSQDCQLCGSRAPASLCVACARDLPHRLSPGCPLCAIEGPDGQLCGQCLTAEPSFDRTIVAFRYAFPLDRLLQSYKFNENLTLTTLFADALLAAVSQRGTLPTTLPDTIVPLPLAKKRLAERGFNQSALLAERVAGKLGVAYDARGLLKVRDTPPQAGLNREARLKNVRGVFDCDDGDALAGKHIAIVDDVMTTGATLSEAAKTLKRAGAASVSAWVVARAGREWLQNPAADVAVPF